MRTTELERYKVIQSLNKLGIDYQSAQSLRRISMTLHNWHELECGTENERGSSISIEREDNGEGKPFMRIAFMSQQGKWIENKTPVPDREKGAIKRLEKLMASFPDLIHYIQSDPRGASLYILKKSDVNGASLDSVYTRGIAVY